MTRSGEGGGDAGPDTGKRHVVGGRVDQRVPVREHGSDQFPGQAEHRVADAVRCEPGEQ
jgi:hypothetical protein